MGYDEWGKKEAKTFGPGQDDRNKPFDLRCVANRYYPRYDGKQTDFIRPPSNPDMERICLQVMNNPEAYEPWQVRYYGIRWEKLGRVMPTEAKEYLAKHYEEAQNGLADMLRFSKAMRR